MTAFCTAARRTIWSAVDAASKAARCPPARSFATPLEFMMSVISWRTSIDGAALVWFIADAVMNGLLRMVITGPPTV